MLYILVLEDNTREMQYLCTFITKNCADCTIVKAVTAEDALRLSVVYSVDLFFLDVELPEINGFQFAEKLRANSVYQFTPIIFVTGVKADHVTIHKKYHHYDYLQKPFTEQHFCQQVLPLLLHIQENRSAVHTAKPEREKIILLEMKGDISYVKVSDILYCEAYRKVVHVVCADKIFQGVKMSMESFIAAVGDPFFVRCHKSFAVNIKQIAAIHNAGRRLWTAFFRDGQNDGAQISETYYENVYCLFQQYFKEGR